MTVYFDNCPSCRYGAIELPDGTSVSVVIDECKKRWGDGSLVRYRQNGGRRRSHSLVYVHDMDAPWIGCCAERVYGTKAE
jgi:hypothetical protein